MSPRKRRGPGRPTDDPRKHFVAVRLTSTEAAALERIRRQLEAKAGADAKVSQSDALRSLIPTDD